MARQRVMQWSGDDRVLVLVGRPLEGCYVLLQRSRALCGADGVERMCGG